MTPGFGFEGSLASSPLSFLVSHRAGQVIAVLALLAGAALLLRGTPVHRFLLVTLALMIVSMTLGLGGISSRHVLLLSVPAVILCTLLLVDLTRRVGRLAARHFGDPLVAQALCIAPATLIVFAWVGCGTQYAFLQQDAWKAAGLRAEHLVGQTDDFIQAHPEADTLYLINMPDSAPSPTGDAADVMFMFRNSPPSLIRLTHPAHASGSFQGGGGGVHSARSAGLRW
jgi:hypothetical protein